MMILNVSFHTSDKLHNENYLSSYIFIFMYSMMMILSDRNMLLIVNN
jgi:hypothetical protein